MTDEPVVIPTASRPARIAALHAAGLWLAEHNGLPMPEKIDMVRHCGTLEQLRALSELSGEPIQERGGSVWVTVPVTVEILHGITIEYTLFGPHIPSTPSDQLRAAAHKLTHPEPLTTPMDLPPRGEGIHTDPWADVMPDPRDTSRGY